MAVAAVTPEERADRAMPEKLLKAEVLKLAKHHGWKVQHLSHEPKHAYRSGGKGFPDLVLARADREPLFIELKREDQELEPEQQEWAAALGAYHNVCRPSDLRLGILHRVLA